MSINWVRKVVRKMAYYVKVLEREAKESKKPYQQLRVTDRVGVSRNYFPAYGVDLTKIPSSMQSEFPTKMVPVFVEFVHSIGQDGRAELKVVSVGEIDAQDEE